MLQWFIRFPEFTEFQFHLDKTPVTQKMDKVKYLLKTKILVKKKRKYSI